MNVKLPKTMYISGEAAANVLNAIGAESAWIDFSSVMVVNAAFADTLLGGIWDKYQANSDIFVGFRDINLNVYADLQRAAENLRARVRAKNFGFICLSSQPRQLSLIGSIQPSVGVAWTLTKQYGELSPGLWRIRDGEKLTVAAYSTYLKDAYDGRLLKRKGGQDGTGYMYYLPPMPEVT